jgi:hypothetical protein
MHNFNQGRMHKLAYFVWFVRTAWAQLTHDKTNYERLLKEIEKKIEQLHQQLMKS